MRSMVLRSMSACCCLDRSWLASAIRTDVGTDARSFSVTAAVRQPLLLVLLLLLLLLLILDAEADREGAPGAAELVSEETEDEDDKWHDESDAGAAAAVASLRDCTQASPSATSVNKRFKSTPLPLLEAWGPRPNSWALAASPWRTSSLGLAWFRIRHADSLHSLSAA